MPHPGREIEQDRGIQSDVFCAGCGYNLRTRPVIGRCPECGEAYNSRPLGMMGILIPQDIRLPVEDLIWTALTFAGGIVLLYVAVTAGKKWAYCAAVPLLMTSLLLAWMSARQSRRYFRHRSLIRRANEQMNER